MSLRIALLHLAPVPGEVAHNRRLIDAAVTAAARAGARWIITPEFGVSGFTFADRIGTDWILEQPDPWMSGFRRRVADLSATVFLSHPERDAPTGALHNSVFVIGPDGAILGVHRKINTLRVGSEAWSTPGDEVAAIEVAPVGRVGVLVCADAYSPWIAKSLEAQGARLLVSCAAWAPGLHGPNGEWEQCTLDTGLPLLVCNRTGPDETMSFREAESVVVAGGRRLLSLRSEGSAIFAIDWDPSAGRLASERYQRIDV
ncbi:MAG TPA: carbon-nitrogen hydrolase family protein [Methylomirabilota bacterium]